ncbi:UNVERIFIED_CONTAM: hypothetical protein FKN15_030912 [Acipenser sinensis]
MASSLPLSESQLLPGNNFTTECNIPGNFMCGDGKCVPGGWQCDGLPDCFDESDERGCPRVKSRCAPTFFACASGMHCIIGRFRCNGFEDCPDGSDEENCTANPLLCSTTRFHCKNGRCVDRSFLCNGQDNCQDNTDEEDCESTSALIMAVEVMLNVCRCVPLKDCGEGPVMAADTTLELAHWNSSYENATLCMRKRLQCTLLQFLIDIAPAV